MSRCIRLLLLAAVTSASTAGCSSLASLQPTARSSREAAIRDGIWSESTLIRGASPDDTVATLILADTTDSTPSVGHARGQSPDEANGGSTGSSAQPCEPFRFADDIHSLTAEFCHDVDSVFNCRNLAVLVAAGGVSYLFHETLDDDVAEGFERHPNRWGKSQEIIAGIGNPGHQFAAAGGLYLYSLHTQDAELHEMSKTLFNALAITGLSTVALKATIGRNTTAPNREPDPFGGAWPSGHTSSSFAFAAVLDEYCGPKVGIPAYILAGLVGWERIDDGEHDLSDVVFGAALGYVIGKAVACERHNRICGMELQPLVDPATGATGLCLERHF